MRIIFQCLLLTLAIFHYQLSWLCFLNCFLLRGEDGFQQTLLKTWLPVELQHLASAAKQLSEFNLCIIIIWLSWNTAQRKIFQMRWSSMFLFKPRMHQVPLRIFIIREQLWLRGRSRSGGFESCRMQSSFLHLYFSAVCPLTGPARGYTIYG